MRQDNIDHVKAFYKLNETDISNLMACGVGEGLLLVGNEIIPIKFKPTDHEMAVIKGKKQGQKSTQKTSLDTIFKLAHESLNELATEHGIYIEDWIEGDPNVLSRLGFEARIVQRAVGRGTQRAWIKSDLLIGDMIGNQSIDHYSTVLQIAGYLQQRGVTPQINHYENVDIVVELGTEKIAFEYERPGSHTMSELIKKKQEFETKYNKVFFIGTAENIKLLSEAVGSECAVRRGSKLSDLIADLIEQYEPKITQLEST
jgi:hypothetical protein